MHTVLEKIKMKSFEGEVDIHGTLRGVAYCELNEDEPSVLVIKGLSVDDALHVLDRLHGGLLKGADAENIAPTPQTAVRPAPGSGPSTGVTNGKSKPSPKPEPTPAPEDVDVDMGDPAMQPGIDIEALSKMEKLRPVIEHFVAAGFKTATEIAKVAADYKTKVPALVEVEARGNFDKRMERAALVVLGGETAS